jgi:shikimate dehydrogenase
MSMLDEVDDLAGKIGAVNTLVNNNGRIVGYNTDAIGALKALEVKTVITGQVCLLIGAGGAAQAIGYILKLNGANLVVCNRSKERGKALALQLNCPFIPLEKIEDLDGEILINTTPVGMSPHVDQCPVPEVVIKEGMVVMDIVYNPLKTKLIALAESKGCLTVDGLGMLIQQGMEQFRLWTGLEPPVDIMRSAVKEALDKNSQHIILNV